MGSKVVVGSPEFHAERMTGIGASEVGAILGVNPWKSAVDVWLEKTGKKVPFEGNDATYWGGRLEDLVAQEYSLRTGRTIRRCNFTLRRGALIGHVDRLVVPDDGSMPAVKDDVRTNRALECKTARDSYGWDDGIPAHYEAQGYSYMAICPSVQVVDFAALFLSERKFEMYPLTRDDRVIEIILARTEAWWDKHIVHGEMPDPVSEDDCKALWGRHVDEKVCYATPDVEKALARLNGVKEASKRLASRESSLKTVIYACMKDAEILKDGSGQKVLATYKNNKDGAETNWEAIARSFFGQFDEKKIAELVKNHTAVVPGARVLRRK